MTTSRALIVSVLVLGTACASANRTARPRPANVPDATAKDIERGGDQPIEQILQTKSPGVSVARTPDGGISVQIRGPATFYGSSEPLYIIDGVPSQTGRGGVLMGVNPHDIDTITVLKNPEDTGVYGVRGGNGVIVITLKRFKSTSP